jgi:hypothetical protein
VCNIHETEYPSKARMAAYAADMPFNPPNVNDDPSGWSMSHEAKFNGLLFGKIKFSIDCAVCGSPIF